MLDIIKFACTGFSEWVTVMIFLTIIAVILTNCINIRINISTDNRCCCNHDSKKGLEEKEEDN